MYTFYICRIHASYEEPKTNRPRKFMKKIRASLGRLILYMNKPLSLRGYYLVEEILIQRSQVAAASAETVFQFALQLAHLIDQLDDQREKDWDAWSKEQYRITEKNRATVKAAQTNCAYCNRTLDK